MKAIYSIILFSAFFLFNKQVNGQCTATVSTFPFHEDFEATNGNFTPGGTNSDWSWGTPIKPTISTAASGVKCWVTGGLAGSSYTNAQNSFLQSPCFNFSGLQHPQIAVKVFWETERRFDGASLQYSTDNGNTWNTLGTDNSNNCVAVNWFNTQAITYLGATKGWSGNVQPTNGSCLGGSGSNGWLLAKHDLSFLAGQPNVSFRFTFGAGTTCNNYDGFGIDDFNISETPPGTAGFTIACGDNFLRNFSNTSSMCAANFQWNFGDASSGADNTSTDENPFHIFSAPGTYTITLNVQFPNGTSATASKSITVLSASVTTTNIQCYGNAGGAASIAVTGGTGSYSYFWNTTPARTTSSITNMIAGSYNVNVTYAGACPLTLTANILEPPQLTSTPQITNEKCGNGNGAVDANVQGGIAPYVYSWSTGSQDASLQQLSAGSYYVTATDANGCKVSASGVVRNDINPIVLNLGNDTTICPGETLVLNIGNFNSIQWNDGTAASTLAVTNSGWYSVKVADADGCTASDTIKVTVDCTDIYFPSAFTPNNDGRNDAFGAIGNIGAVKNYTLKLYSRWGDELFITKDPYTKWNGSTKGLPAASGVLAWFAEYSINGKKRTQKGSVTLIR